MNDILCRQLALDYCCGEADVRDRRNHFTEYRFLEGRRRFQNSGEVFLEIAAVNGKLLFTGDKRIIDWCRDNYENEGAAWFFEASQLRTLDNKLKEHGYEIRMVHPFFLPEEKQRFVTSVPSPSGAYSSGAHLSDAHSSPAGHEVRCHEIRWYQEAEIEQFRGDSRFPEAFTFCETAPDVIGVSAVRDGKILGMAGASRDSEIMWQIGINVEPEHRREGIGTELVALLKDAILERGILPYYGTALSHIGSQRVAYEAGFSIAWVELVTQRVR